MNNEALKRKYRAFLRSAEEAREAHEITFAQFKIDNGYDVDVQDMNTDELIEEFRAAVEELPGRGARGRSRYYAAEEEIKRRLNEK